MNNLILFWHMFKRNEQKNRKLKLPIKDVEYISDVLDFIFSLFYDEMDIESIISTFQFDRKITLSIWEEMNIHWNEWLEEAERDHMRRQNTEDFFNGLEN